MKPKNEIQATLRFIKRWPGYAAEKPYTIDMRVGEWKGDIPRSNYKSHEVKNISVRDIRGEEDQFIFEANGFAVLEMQSTLSYEDFAIPRKVDDIYCPEIASCLMQYFDAAAVQIYDFEIRRRHERFPNIHMNLNMHTQPAQKVHIDGTVRSCVQILEETGSAAFQYKRHLFVNVWRPLKGPLYDWPLALCDAQSVDTNDFTTHDHVFTDYARENIMIHHNPRQTWHYLSGQMPSELLVFRQADSEGKTGVPHCSFDLPKSPAGQSMLRESIEVRAVVLFDQ